MNGHSNLPNKTLVTKTYQSDLAHNNNLQNPKLDYFLQKGRLWLSASAMQIDTAGFLLTHYFFLLHVFVCMIACVCIHMCVCLDMCMCMSVCVSVCVCMSMFVYVCMCICVCLSACVSVCVCLFLCLCACACHIIHTMEVKRTWKNWFSPSSPLKLSLDSK